MYPTTDLARLRDFFAPDDLEWKPITISKKTGKGLAAAYITNRAIMERLDLVVGAENWRNEYRPGPSGGVVCGLSVRVVREDGTGEWVTKWDGADNTDIEAVKGGLSNAMRRAAVQWGIGRYLYDIPSQWVPIDEWGKFTQAPRLPREFVPASARAAAPERSPERPAERPSAERPADRPLERAAPAERPAPADRPERAAAPERTGSAERPMPVVPPEPGLSSERPARPAEGYGGGDGGGRFDAPPRPRPAAPRER